MAPSRTYFARLETAEYVPISRDGNMAFSLFGLFDSSSLIPVSGRTLADSDKLLGTLLDGRPATVGDLRAGRAADIYWAIEGPEKPKIRSSGAFWKTLSDTRWTDPRDAMDTAYFVLEYVVHAEACKDGTWKVLEESPKIHVHACRFRTAMNKASNKVSDKVPEASRGWNTLAEAPEAPKKIDLKRTDDPVDFAAFAALAKEAPGMVRVSRALYVVLNYGWKPSPDLLYSGPATYLVPAAILEHVSYGRLVESVMRLEYPNPDTD